MAASMIMEHFMVFGLIFLLSQVSCQFDDEFEGQRTLALEHSFDQGSNPQFTHRGTIVIRSVKQNRAVFSQNAPLTQDEKKALKEATEVDGLYRVRVPLKGTGEDDDYVTTFSKACHLYESSLSDTLMVSVDQSGEVLGISMTTPASHCSGIDVPSANITDWQTSVEISQTVGGPVPDTQSYIEKIKREEQDKVKGAQGESNQSFFAKYWMYIVPFVIMMFVMNSMNPDQGAGNGGGGGGR